MCWWPTIFAATLHDEFLSLNPGLKTTDCVDLDFGCDLDLDFAFGSLIAGVYLVYRGLNVDTGCRESWVVEPAC